MQIDVWDDEDDNGIHWYASKGRPGRTGYVRIELDASNEEDARDEAKERFEETGR